MIFDNLKSLKKDMESKGWVIDAFIFDYKHTKYIVLVKLFVKNELKPQYALVKMEFMKYSNMNDKLMVHANGNGIMNDTVKPNDIRNFFGIQYQENWGDFMQQFNERLSKSIPSEVKEKSDTKIMSAIVVSLDKSDSQNPDRLYCYKVKRNGKDSKGKQIFRSSFNDNKTIILR